MDNRLLLFGGVAVIVILGIIALGAMLSYNSFISLEQNVNEKWSNVETQYQRRVDLIPNVVNTVKGSAAFEQETLTELTALRSQWQSQPEARVETANQIETALSKLLLITENYPELQSTQAFRDLIVELEGTENRVSFARQEYNSSVRQYNTEIRKFPGAFIAGMFGFEEKEFFESSTGAENAPNVDLG